MSVKRLSPEQAARLVSLVDLKRPNEPLADLVKDILVRAGGGTKPLSARAAYRLTGVDNNTIMNLRLGIAPPRMDTLSRFAQGMGCSDEEIKRLLVYAYGVRLYPASLVEVIDTAVRLAEDIDESERVELLELIREAHKRRQGRYSER
jgi:hypothetical protein